MSRSNDVCANLVSPSLQHTLFTSHLSSGSLTLDTAHLAKFLSFRSRRPVDLPSGTVLDRSSTTRAGVEGLVVLTRRWAQLHSLCFCGRFFEISGIWQHQVLDRIRTICRAFRSRTIVMSRRVYAACCTRSFAFIVSDAATKRPTKHCRASRILGRTRSPTVERAWAFRPDRNGRKIGMDKQNKNTVHSNPGTGRHATRPRSKVTLTG